MRVKKQKRQRKSVRFYTSCFGFREPFKILCDGTFIHHILQNHPVSTTQPQQQSQHQSLLTSLLGAPTKVFTTRCILGELKSLGESYLDPLRAALSFSTARCDHERRKNAAGCIEDVIGGNNSEHFLLATQDVELLKKFQEVPGVPLIYGLRNSLFLEPPSHFQRQFVKLSEEERLHMSEVEYKMLKGRLKKFRSATQGAAGSPHTTGVLSAEVAETDALTNIKPTRGMLGVADKSKFKRKKAKGPNPLSCKKKSRPTVAQNQGGEAGDTTRKKRSRKRKRSHKDSKVVDVTR